MHAWTAIQSTLEIIEARIDEDITIQELADAASLSLFYYQRLFTRLVKKPVRTYIKLRRLARASDALKNSNRRITDIAFDYGFGSYEVFFRAFKEAYGITPSECRQGNIGLTNFEKPNLILNHTMVDLGVPIIADGMVLEINRRVLDKPVRFMGVQGHVPIEGHFPIGEVTGIDSFGGIWQRFRELESQIPAKRDGRRIGVAYHGDAPEGCFPYFVGAEVEPGTTDDNFLTWTLPAVEYMVTGFEAENFEELMATALNKAIKYGHIWEKNYGLKQGNFGAEIYYSHTFTDPDAAYMEMWAQWIE